MEAEHTQQCHQHVAWFSKPIQSRDQTERTWYTVPPRLIPSVPITGISVFNASTNIAVGSTVSCCAFNVSHYIIRVVSAYNDKYADGQCTRARAQERARTMETERAGDPERPQRDGENVHAQWQTVGPRLICSLLPQQPLPLCGF